MPRAGLDSEAVVVAAAGLADSGGLESLTLARLADHLGIRAPSLYAHVESLADLRTRVAIRGVGELTAELRRAAAGRAGSAALRAVADAYRAYAGAHPGTYAAIQRSPAADPDPHPGLERAATELVELIAAVLDGYGLRDEDAIHGVRMVRAALHGFVTLEREGGFALPVAPDETFARLVGLLDQGLQTADGGRPLASAP
jgi:AcrR family transcriptional regulator